MSEYMDNQFQYEQKVERLNIILYSLYCICLAYIASKQNWGMLVFVVFLTTVAVCLSLYLTKSKTFRFRATVTATAMLVCLYIYSVMSKSLIDVLPITIAIVILIGLYEIPELIILSAVFTELMYLHHGIFIRDIRFAGNEWTSNLRMILRLGAVFIAEYSAYYLVYNQKEGRRRQHEYIEELKEAEQSRDDFLANVSHELRTPINTICGMSEMVLREKLPEETRQEVYNIQVSGRNLLSVVSDILDFSELQAGEVDIVEEAYHISSTINDVINLAMARRADKDIELVVDFDATLPETLVGDEQKIRRVIMNLVNNAIKYTQTGCVVIEVGYRREDYGINLTVAVKDTGIGMTDSDIEKLFTGFGQIDTKRNRRDTGIGLGLAISSAIVDGMGGFISVESEYGKGTDIRFSVPQKIAEDIPVAVVEDKAHTKIAIYINMEKLKIQQVRESYQRILNHMVEQLGVPCQICRNLQELRRRVGMSNFSHIFVGFEEYEEDKAYFNELAEHTNLILIIDRENEPMVESSRILRLYKPVFVLPVSLFLNDRSGPGAPLRKSHRGRFVAPKAHILIVDDNLMNIKVAEGLLKPYRINVTKALSGQEALEKIVSMEYDFVFMDHMMPEMDGIECMEHIREIPGSYFKTVPIIALTANAIGGTREMFLEKGFADFVAKPIEISVLERVLRRNLPEEKIEYIMEAELPKEFGENEPGITGKVPGQIRRSPRWGEVGASQPGNVTVEKYRRGQDSEDIFAASRETDAAEIIEPEEGGRQTDSHKLEIEGIDIEQGLIYCGDEENLLEVLELQTEDHSTLPNIRRSFEAEDWKNYTIYVHAVKSTMKSIGAQSLSNSAKALEAAGKSGDIVYIRENEEAFEKEFERILQNIRGYFEGESTGTEAAEEEEAPENTRQGQPGQTDDDKRPETNPKEATPEKTESGQSELPEIPEQEFADMVAEFETNMYAMDESGMTEIIEYLENHSFRGQALVKGLKDVRRKVGMSDYFAAYDALEQLFDRIKE